MRLNIDDEKFLVAIENEGDHEIGAGGRKKIGTKQIVYAFLWRSLCTDNWSKAALQMLLSELSESERKEAIGWLIDEFGPISDLEMISADVRQGTFPKRSYP